MKLLDHEANFYIELGKGEFVAAHAPDELTLGKWLCDMGAGLIRIWIANGDAVKQRMAEMRRPYEVQVEEWWLNGGGE